MTKNTTSRTIVAALSFLLTTAAMMVAFFPATTTTEAWAPTTRSSRRNSRSVAVATRLHGMSVDQLLASPSLQDWTTLETYNSMDDGPILCVFKSCHGRHQRTRPCSA